MIERRSDRWNPPPPQRTGSPRRSPRRSWWSKTSRDRRLHRARPARRGLRRATSPSTATSGEARALAEALDLVILDLMLPGRNGGGVLAELRERKPELPVIMLTARGESTTASPGSTPAPSTTSSSRSPSTSSPPACARSCAARARARDHTLPGARHRARPADARGAARGRAVRALGEGVRPARVPHAPPPAGALARADPQRGVGLRARPGHEHRRGLRELPAAQAAPAPRARADRDRALGRLPARETCGSRAADAAPPMAGAVAADDPALAADRVGRGPDARLVARDLRRRLPRHRQQLRGQIDRDLAGTPRSSSQRSKPSGPRTHRRGGGRARDYVHAQPFAATATLLFP